MKKTFLFTDRVIIMNQQYYVHNTEVQGAHYVLGQAILPVIEQ